MLSGAIYRFGTTLKVGKVLGIGSWSAFRGGKERHQRFTTVRSGYSRARSNSLYMFGRGELLLQGTGYLCDSFCSRPR